MRSCNIAIHILSHASTARGIITHVAQDLLGIGAIVRLNAHGARFGHFVIINAGNLDVQNLKSKSIFVYFTTKNVKFIKNKYQCIYK